MNNELFPHGKTIGFLRRGYSSTGGAEAYLKRLAGGLVQQGYRVILLGTGEWPLEEWPGGEMISLSCKNLRDFAAEAIRVKQQQQINLLFSFERVPGCDIFRAGDGVHASWLKRQEVFQPWWHRLITKINPKHREILQLERELFDSESKTKIIANSQMVAQEIMDYFSVPSSRITVIPNGVPKPPYVTLARIFHTDLLRKPGSPMDESLSSKSSSGSVDSHSRRQTSSLALPHQALPRHDQDEISGLERRAALRKELGMGKQECAVLFVGSGWKRKGLETALMAVERVNILNSKKIMRLWVAGKGKTQGYSSSSVRFLGPIKDVSVLYAAADLFILPTLYDPFSNASLEALAAGLPVITSAANGCSEVLDTTIHGSIIIDARDVGAFAAALSSWQSRLEAPHEAERIRNACAERGAIFNIEKNVQDTLSIIEQVLDSML